MRSLVHKSLFRSLLYFLSFTYTKYRGNHNKRTTTLDLPLGITSINHIERELIDFFESTNWRPFSFVVVVILSTMSNRHKEASTPTHPMESVAENGDRYSFNPTYRNTEFVQAQDAPVDGKKSDVFMRGSLLDRNIEVAALEPMDTQTEHTEKYRGRLKVWPGVLLLLLLIAAAIALIAGFGVKHYNDVRVYWDLVNEGAFEDSKITGGADGSDGIGDIDYGNPSSYGSSTCQLPNYKSKDNKIYAVAANGTEVPISIKGINWFGMETGQAIPYGMWENAYNGTTGYNIASFLSENKFNAVRLPLCVESLLEDATPNSDLINQNENAAINVTDYYSLLQSIVKVLQYRRIGVLISMHTMTTSTSGGLWYTNSISEDDFLDAIDIVVDTLCSQEYWNVIGIDLKNEPYEATWGDGEDTDWRLGAEKIGNRMLNNCSNWLAFVEGIDESHTLEIDGTDYSFTDWYGGGLWEAGEYPIEFDVEDKLVYAPHYYSSAVYPQGYFYDGGTRGSDNELDDYVELDDSTLYSRVNTTSYNMFGYLGTNQSYALLLGEFGGLYSTDAHPELTTQRIINYSIELSMSSPYSGGFVWSLNGESKYQYNPADTGNSTATFPEGVMETDWITANTEYVNGLSVYDTMENLQKFPCFALEDEDD